MRRTRNHKPQDIYPCFERQHQDGRWRLIYSETLWSDPQYDIALGQDYEYLGEIAERGNYTAEHLDTHFRRGLPNSVGTWAWTEQPLTWYITKWYHLTGTELLEKWNERSEQRQWYGYVLKSMINFDDIPGLKTTFDENGLCPRRLALDEPFLNLSAHDRLKGQADYASLKPATFETVRLVVGLD